MYKIIRTSTVPLSLKLFCGGLLRELSSEYEVVALSSPGPELDDLAERDGVRTIALPMQRAIAPLHDLTTLIRLVRIFRRERPQLVHSITPKAGLLSMMAARISGVPVRVHTFTGLLFPTAAGLQRRLLMLTDRLTCRCATHLIAEGEGVRSDLLQYGIAKRPVVVLGHGNVRGIDLAYYDRTSEVVARAVALRQASGLSATAFTFVFVGRIVRDKGIDEMIEAFCALHCEGLDVQLLLVGEEEASDRISVETRQRITDTEAIHRCGWTEDVRPWYAAADALLFPSYREGFPNVVIEAGAMGLPSIVTDINGSREIIRDGETGLIVPPRDAMALLEAMRTLATDRTRAAAMGANARPLVASRYEQGFVREQLKQFYRSILL